ncbi:hypothetical protein NK6_5347 [Bradyrhizobium diazoefficiens]|uniref:Uncharacterized protein n=1 Tax=Bradyrhizobium diazoefficiens TaxID=1355477 RepID=A0A0E4FWR5_9BRAD|nr:hypothetical protein NK6_5347 [Bradyrhizobium diazoefficiens]
MNVHYRDCVSFAVKATDHLLERSGFMFVAAALSR